MLHLIYLFKNQIFASLRLLIFFYSLLYKLEFILFCLYLCFLFAHIHVWVSLLKKLFCSCFLSTWNLHCLFLSSFYQITQRFIPICLVTVDLLNLKSHLLIVTNANLEFLSNIKHLIKIEAIWCVSNILGCNNSILWRSGLWRC